MLKLVYGDKAMQESSTMNLKLLLLSIYYLIVSNLNQCASMTRNLVDPKTFRFHNNHYLVLETITLNVYLELRSLYYVT